MISVSYSGSKNLLPKAQLSYDGSADFTPLATAYGQWLEQKPDELVADILYDLSYYIEQYTSVDQKRALDISQHLLTLEDPHLAELLERFVSYQDTLDRLRLQYGSLHSKSGLERMLALQTEYFSNSEIEMLFAQSNQAIQRMEASGIGSFDIQGTQERQSE